MDGRVCALQRRCVLSYLAGKTWPTAGSEPEVPKDRKWAHSGKYLRSGELEREEEHSSHVRRLAIVELNVGNAWHCDGYGPLLPSK